MRIPLSVAALSLLAGCGTLWPTVNTQSTSSVREVLACTDQEVKALGYNVRADRGASWIEARKEVKAPDYRSFQEIRRYDVLFVEASKKGDATALRIQARSMSEQSTRRGPTVVDEAATEDVKGDAQTVADRCGGQAATAG